MGLNWVSGSHGSWVTGSLGHKMSGVSGGSTVDVAAATTAVTIATEPSAPAVVNDADQSAGTSDDTILMADYCPQDGD